MSETTILIILGAMLTAVGVLGGGFEIKELKVPRVGTVPRALALVIGLALIAGPAYRNWAPGEQPQDAHSPSERKNWARSGTTIQSSTLGRGEAHLAIDGITEGHWSSNSVTHTADKEDSWWGVRLSERILVDEIILYNRTDDCCVKRLSNFRLTLMDESGQEVYRRDFPGPVGGITIVPVERLSARIVRIGLLGRNKENNGYLSLAEVEVYGRRSR